MMSNERIENDPVILWLRALDERRYVPADLIVLRTTELSQYDRDRDELLRDVAYLKMRDGYTQKMLASAIGLSPSRVNMILRGGIRSEKRLYQMIAVVRERIENPEDD